MKTAGVLLFLANVLSFAGVPARVIYTRAFPGSSPDYFRVAIDQAGALEYCESPNGDQTLHAHLQPAEVAPIFNMASKLDEFKAPLESGLKVANTGKKTFRYDNGDGGNSETTFNYSTNLVAQQLVDKFEQIASSERAYLDLDRTVHFDKLGVNDSLATIESLWLHKQLAAPAQFIPLLNRVATHESFMHIARDRAARLKDEFEKPGAAVSEGDPRSK
ncbi:MAG TPA: hypothetical protein VHZ55_08485 [Bryobacteraceae bacterium]|nr:hypothetical protein [Bryobacteraceae bacterium]